MITQPDDRTSVVTGRFEAVDGLRAVAAFSIVLHHVSIPSGVVATGWDVASSGLGAFAFGEPNLAGILGRLDIGVAIFFVISGFLLYRPFVTAALGETGSPPTVPFLVRRAARIFPAFWIAFILIDTIPFFGFQSPPEGVRAYAEYLTLTHVYFSFERASGAMSQSWTLAVEITFYLALPAYAALLRRMHRRRVGPPTVQLEFIGLGALVVVAYAFRLVCAYGGVPHLETLGQYWLPANLDWFALGMGLAVGSVAATTEPFRSRWTAWGRRAWAWWTAGALAFWWLGVHAGLPKNYFTPASPAQTLLIHAVYGIVAFALVAPVVMAPTSGGGGRRMLRSVPFIFLGTISYGVYLWHQAVIWHFVRDEPAFSVDYAPLLLIASIGATVIATTSWYAFERPIISRVGQSLRRVSLRRGTD